MLVSSQIKLLKRAMDLMNDNENVTRCSEDTYLCTVEGQNELLTQPLEYLCYYTGDLLYNMTKHFTKVLAFFLLYSSFVSKLRDFHVIRLIKQTAMHELESICSLKQAQSD